MITQSYTSSCDLADYVGYISVDKLDKLYKLTRVTNNLISTFANLIWQPRKLKDEHQKTKNLKKKFIYVY